ncbi:MAG: ABC transporter ATP-binding protein [Muribaculaceae bacterium]|nr:ABC transporter ATP-binding protein [Muribaculaceae bacterium]
MLNIQNLSFRYPRRSQAVLDDFSLKIDNGGIYGLLGPNGAGKSTLLYLISGLLTPKTGEVKFNGVNTRLRLPETLNDIFIVPEELTLPALKLDSYVKMNAPFYPRFSYEDLQRHLATFEVGDIARYKLSSLSMGQKKKIFMSFALACNTSLLLMDEPTNGLDIPGKAAFRRFIASSASDDKIIVISTHQVRDIDRILDHVIIMDEHRLLLNESINAITDRLAFLATADKELIARALVAQPGIGGAQIVIENDGSLDTEVNLESLFELATTRRDIINALFNRQNAEAHEN